MLFSYIDPFTGSVILQVLAAGFLGFLAFFRPIWYFLTGSRTSKVAKDLDDWDEKAENSLDSSAKTTENSESQSNEKE